MKIRKALVSTLMVRVSELEKNMEMVARMSNSLDKKFEEKREELEDIKKLIEDPTIKIFSIDRWKQIEKEKGEMELLNGAKP